LITGGVYWDVKIYDGTALIKTLTLNTEEYRFDLEADPYSNPVSPDASGCYHISWTDTTLEGGKVYTVVTGIQIGSGGTFNTPSSLDVTTTKEFASMKDLIKERIDIPMSQVSADVQMALDTQMTLIQTEMGEQATMIQTKMDEQTGIIQTKMDEFSASTQESLAMLQSGVTDIKDAGEELAAVVLETREELEETIAGLDEFQEQVEITTTKLTTAVEEATTALVSLVEDSRRDLLAAANEVEMAGKKFAPELLLPPSALIGDKLAIRYTSFEGLQPMVKVLTHDNKVAIDYTPMVASEKQPDLYEYEIEEIKGDVFTVGKPMLIIVLCEISAEPLTTNMETASVMVESTSLTAIEGLVATTPGLSGEVRRVSDAIKAVKAELSTGGAIQEALRNLDARMERLPKEISRAIAKDETNVRMMSAVDDLTRDFGRFVGEEGYDFGTLLESGLEKSESIADIRTKTTRVQGAAKIMQDIIEQEFLGTDKPIVHVLFE
jgi:hypothetical protein